MKTFLNAYAFALCLFQPTFAQKQESIRELRGDGNIVTKAYQVADFEAIEIQQLPADVIVDLSDKTPSVQVSIDENLLCKVVLTGK